MTMTLGSFPRLLEPGIRSIFGASYKEHPLYSTRIFETRNSTKNAETSVQITGMGLARRKESGAVIAGIVGNALVHLGGYIKGKHRYTCGNHNGQCKTRLQQPRCAYHMGFGLSYNRRST